MKKKVLIILLILVLLPLVSIGGFFAYGVSSGKISLPVAKKELFVLPNSNYQYLDSLQVDGLRLVDESGNEVILNGVMVPDPRKIDRDRNFKEAYFKEVFGLGGNVVRVPVTPTEWENDEYYLWRYLDPIVTWAVKYNSYVILDMHYIGNLESNKGEVLPKKSDSIEFAFEFWKVVAAYFKDVPNVIYEVYNEPALISESTWGKYAKKLLDPIRIISSNQLVIMSCIDYSSNLYYWMNNPIDDANVIYSAHYFASHAGVTRLTEASKVLPLIVTEWGYCVNTDIDEHKYLIGTKEKYAMPLLEVMNNNKISWVACWYDNGWEPAMFNKDGSRNEWGEFALSELAKNSKIND